MYHARRFRYNEEFLWTRWTSAMRELDIDSETAGLNILINIEYMTAIINDYFII